MNLPVNTCPPRLTIADWIARTGFFLLMVLVMITLPLPPANELDASWRMALGRFFSEGRQFGVDVVFTYGPLGFLMGKTYSGGMLTSLILWQLFQAVLFTTLIFRLGLQLQGYSRYAYFVFFYLFGITYEDSLYLHIIALAGFELLREEPEERRGLNACFGILLGGLSLFKFTNLMIAGIFAASAAGLYAWRSRYRQAIWLLGWTTGSFLLGWVLCRQNPLNLPAYLLNSWEISQGYSETMGIPTPPEALRIGLITLGLVGGYLLIYSLTLADRARAMATSLALAAYIFLSWKHGYVRADGHMIGFFYAVLLPATACPVLLGDAPRWGFLRHRLLNFITLSALIGINVALPGLVRGCLGNLQERFFDSFIHLQNPSEMVERYKAKLAEQRGLCDLPETRAIVGKASIDMLGFEQGAILFNDFNYQPRPVFQSYSVYRPRLSRLNADYYASKRAPQYALLKLQTIDRRLVTFDDPEVLHLLTQRYTYVQSEKGYQLWKLNPGPFSEGEVAPRLLHSARLVPGQPFMVDDFNRQPLWVTVDVQPSMLGRLVGFVYKLPIVLLRLQDTHEAVSEYRMPLPQGRTGFIVNPMVEDPFSYMNFAGGHPERILRSLTLVIAPKDRSYFADEYKVTIYSLPPSNAGREFFRQAQQRLFHMFNVVPVSYEAHTPLSEGIIDGKSVMVFHMPSEMLLDVPKGSTEIHGLIGFMPGAYSNGGNTQGGVFTVKWVLGSEEVVLFEKKLDPVHRTEDRGLHSFKAALPPRAGGRLVLRTDPVSRNAISWGWTCWSELTLK